MGQYCHECGTRLSDEASFCEQCGAPVPETADRDGAGQKNADNSPENTSQPPIPTTLVPWMVFLQSNARSLAILGIILLVISLFLPSHLMISLTPVDSSATTNFTVYVDYASSFNILTRIFTDILPISPDSYPDVFITLGAICIAAAGFFKSVPRLISISGILCIISYAIFHVNFDIGSLVGIFGFIIIASLILAIIGYIRHNIFGYIVSAVLCLFQWIIFPYANTPGLINSIWAVVIIVGSLCLMISGEFLMKHGDTP